MGNGITRKPSKVKAPHPKGCMCNRCRRNRERTFNLSARIAANRIASQGNRSATAALPNDGIFTQPFTPVLPGEVDDAGNLIPDDKFTGKGVTDTQLKVKPIFSPIGRTKQQQHSDVVSMVPADREPGFIGPMPLVESVTKVHQTTGLVPVRSLLRRSANFDPDWGAYKRRTSRSKEVTRPDKGNGPIDAEVSRMSFRRPDFIEEQQRQEVKLMDLELGLPSDEITDLVVDKPTNAAADMADSIDAELADLTDWD